MYLVLFSICVQESLMAANFPDFPITASNAEAFLQGSKVQPLEDVISSPQNTDELELEAMLIEYIEKDIKDFEDMKNNIAFLEKHIRHHADVHVADSKELLEADHVLQELDVKVIKPYELQLESLKSQIFKLNHMFDNETLDQITTIVENVEVFLETSRERIEQVEILEQEWEVAEETFEIENMIRSDEKSSGKIIIESLKPKVSDEAKKKLKLTSKVLINSYPVKQIDGSKVSLGKSSTDPAKSMYKKMRQMKMLKKDEQIVLSTKPSIKVLKVSIDNLDQQEVNELAKIAALKEIKVNLDREALIDLRGRDPFVDPVEHYDNDVKEALEVAKELSHEFMDHQLHHQDDVLVTDKVLCDKSLRQDYLFLFLGWSYDYLKHVLNGSSGTCCIGRGIDSLHIVQKNKAKGINAGTKQI